MKFFLFGMAILMSVAYWLTKDAWYLLPQWTCLLAGIFVTFFDCVDVIKQGRRDHEQHLKFMEEHKKFMEEHRRK